MGTTLPIALTTLTVGTHDFGPTTVADTVTNVLLTVDRTVVGGFNSQPSTTQANIGAQISFDGGATWHPAVSGTIGGGVFVTPQSTTMTFSSVGSSIVPGVGRQMKATIIVSGASVAVAGTLAFTP